LLELEDFNQAIRATSSDEGRRAMGLDALDGFVVLRQVGVSYRANKGRFCLTAELA